MVKHKKTERPLHQNIRLFLSIQGKKGGKSTAKKHKEKLAEWGRKGGLKRAENKRLSPVPGKQS